MDRRWRIIAVGGLAAVAVCATAPLVVAATKKKAPAPAQSAAPMSVEEARRIAAKTAAYTRPPRTIDDITKVLDQHKPDPEKIRKLRETADKKTPPGLSGMALADFLAARGLAARDLGRTQQRLADLREAYKHARPLVAQRSPISVVDFPTASNPQGSANFQAYVNAKRAAKRAARQAAGPGPGGGGGGGPRDLSSMLPHERVNYMRRQAAGGGGGRGGPGGGGGGGGGMPSGMTNLDFMPKSPEESQRRFAERVSPTQQRAVRIWQNLITAEADAGNYRTATALYEEMRPNVITSMAGVIVHMDVRIAIIRLNAGDVEGARRVAARTQQMLALYRQHHFLSPLWNNQSSSYEMALAEIAAATGRLADAEVRFRNAMRFNQLAIKDGPRMPSPLPAASFETGDALLRLQLAQTLFRQNKLIEAELETRRALLDFLRLQGVDAPKTAHTVLIFADIVQAQGRYKDAQRLAEIALDIYVRGGVDPAVHADALQRIAVAQASQGRWADAMATYEKLKVAVANSESARKRYLDTNVDLAVALVRAGQATAAIPILEGVVQKRTAEGGDNEYSLAEARGFLGAAFAAAGRDGDALRTLRTALPTLLTASDASAKEEGAVDETRRRQLIVESYFVLLTRVRGTELEKTLGIDATDEAFRMADVAHAQSVHSAIASSSARAASGDAALNELIRQTQDTDQQLTGLSDMLRTTLAAPAAEQDQSVLQALRRDIAQLQQARRTLRTEIERRFPQYAELVNPKPVGIAAARGKLRDGDTLVVTYFTGGTGYVWAVPKAGEVTFARMTLPETEVIGLVDELHKAVNSGAASISEIPAFNVAAAHKLYTGVLEPVAKGWRGAKNIIVVPHGALGRMPFSLMVTKAVPQPEARDGVPRFTGYREVPFLIREATVTKVPSVAAFSSLRSVPAGAANRKPFIGFGDPWFSADQADLAQRRQEAIQLAALSGPALAMRAAPNTQSMATAELAQLPRLPDTADEVREIARALGADPEQDVLLGPKASEKAVRSVRLDDRRVVMFATHGLVPGELDGLVQPALALSSPAVAGVEGDGLLTVEKILGLKLDADWVVLSACNTAAGEGGSAEAVSGLGRAFFYAGARAILVTHWPVETTSARALTTDLFRRQAATPQLSRAAALREAMLHMIDKGERADDGGRPHYAYAHPLFWASFALIGDGESR